MVVGTVTSIKLTQWIEYESLKLAVVGSNPIFYIKKQSLMFPMIKIHQRSGDKRYFERLVKWLRHKFWVLR